MSCASRMKSGRPPKWSPWRCVRKIVAIEFGSTLKWRIATSEVAPQSIRKFSAPAATWKQVLNRPPVPKATPLPRNQSRMTILCSHSRAGSVSNGAGCRHGREGGARKSPPPDRGEQQCEDERQEGRPAHLDDRPGQRRANPDRDQQRRVADAPAVLEAGLEQPGHG